MALRCRIVLAAAHGGTNNEVADQFGVHPATVSKWHAGLWNGAWMVCSMSLARGRLARSPTKTWWLRRGPHRSTKHLEAAIQSWIDT